MSNNKEPKDPTKLVPYIILIALAIFLAILYFAINLGYLPLLGAVIVLAFAAAMWAINKDKLR